MDTVGGGRCTAEISIYPTLVPGFRRCAPRSASKTAPENAGLPEFRTNMCRKSGKPDLR
jgi:hypothetical protein